MKSHLIAKVAVCALMLSYVNFISTPLAKAAAVTATGTNPSVCNQEVSNSTNVVAYRLAGGDCVVEFKNTATTNWTAPVNASSISLLVVAGGGGGGFGSYSGGSYGGGGGGGGGGQVRYVSTVSVNPGSQYSIVVGAGGSTQTPDSGWWGGKDGLNGENSSAFGYTSIGGKAGRGGGYACNGLYAWPSTYVDGSSGCGGDSGNGSYSGGLGSNRTSAVYDQGGGGGGGDSSAGNNSSGTSGANGGTGTTTTITSSSLTFGRGGNGGAGGSAGNILGTSGGANTGNGGGGGSGGLINADDRRTSGIPGNGGSGIVIIRFTPDTTAPSFTSSSSFSAAENIAITSAAATIKVSESATVTISSGADASLFTISNSDTVTALIKFKASPNYEAPSDSGGNNVYDLVLTATDSASNAGTQTITITVTDVVDTSSFNSFSLSATPAYRTVVTITANVSVAAKVTFRAKNVIISGCKNKLATGSGSSFSATCTWRPSVRGAVVLTATAAPTGAGITSSTATPLSVMVGNRSGGR